MRYLCFLCLFYVLSSPSSLYSAETSALLLTESGESIFPAEQMSFLLDPQGTLTLEQATALEFAPLASDEIDFGFTTDKIWLHFKVVNAGSGPISKVLRSSARFMRPMEIFLLRDNSAPEQLLYNDETLRFGERPLPELRFLATEFTLDTAEEADFYIRFGAGGQASMALQISDREQAIAEQFRATTGIVMYCTILITLILVNFFHFLAVRKLAYLAYVFYETLNLIYVPHMEGFTFQYLWPNLPGLNDDATPVIASLGLIVGNCFAMVFLETRKYAPLIHRFILGFLAISIVSLLISLFADNRIGNQIAAPLLPVFLLLSVVAAAVVATRGHYPARYFLVAWSLFGVTAVIWSGTILGVIDLSFNILTPYKIAVATQAIIFSMGLADQVGRINNQYVETQKSLIENLQGRLEDARERIKLERDNEKTMLQLLQKSKQLATTSHDINQPIQSLRLALKALSLKSPGQDNTKDLENTLDHMESVLGNALDEASLDLKKTSEQSSIRSLHAGSLIQTVVDQFSAIASEKQLTLKCFSSSAILVAQELPLKRCLLNLLSNAIKNTDRGGVLIGARHRGDNLLFQVYDTGRGIARENMSNLLEPLAKGEESTGYGLGLAIIQEICNEYSWQFNVLSVENKGSCFSISVPIRIET